MVVHAHRGSQHISSIFGLRLRQTGSLSSMGRVASSVDNTMMESLESTMQRELRDRRCWRTRTEFAAIFEWIEAFYNPVPGTPASTTTPQPNTKAFTTPPPTRHD